MQKNLLNKTMLIMIGGGKKKQGKDETRNEKMNPESQKT